MHARFRSLLLVLLLPFTLAAHAARYDLGGPRSTSNDDSCDIADLPAATLLLPYFEVDLSDINGETTLFTVTNVTEFPQIARATIWTDLGVPLVSFNIFLTGFDVQAINLRDVLTLGRTGGTGTGVSNFGPLGRPSNTNIDARGCIEIAPLSQETIVRVQRALTEGVVPGCEVAGEAHANAIGYVTVDVVAACTGAMPVDANYFAADLRNDNVLIGDYQQLNMSQNFAQGGPMVHIRAVPEGRNSGPSNLTRTFYGRFTKNGSDARQPLPSRFAARWIRAGATSFQTDIKIWRELSGRAGTCPPASEVRAASDQAVFDETENGAGGDGSRTSSPPIFTPITIPAALRASISDPEYFVQLSNGATAGWLYLNLDDPSDEVAEQGWMITSMRAEGRYSADQNASGLGNGCSPAEEVSQLVATAGTPIGPSPNGPTTIFPTGAPLTRNNDDSCDIAQLPAATLLLPYFEVSTSPAAQTTLFTITNVTNTDQIARVTLWTDYGYPVISFNLFLTGYDVQAINLFDVIERGIIAPDNGTGTAVRPRGRFSSVNPSLALGNCDRLPGALDPTYVSLMRQAFRQGRVPALGSVVPACDVVGNTHERNVGYATIDVVGNCGFLQPTEPNYFSQDIRYDNVLIGDYQQVDASNNSAQGNPLVHIRAIPEGGTPASRQTSPSFVTNLERTFYKRLTTPQFSDARQPLPSTFAARWIAGGPDAFNTSFKVWREVPNGPGNPCGSLLANGMMAVSDTVVFDEAENAATLEDDLTLPATSLLAAAPMPNGAISGWTYFNLDRDSGDRIATQNWVTVSMRALNRFSVDFEASALGNGCSPEHTGTTIGPAR
ncbi:MAG TPA: hypothetical protein VEO54_00990 [Thermoanaerobaculia bacterium]|nr:hypothetical protein [Thermoanaerobaculia bacterium]